MAPIPGETKVWQYVSLMKRIYLIDCPGIVPPSSQDTPTDLVLRGVARVEKVENPEQYIDALLKRVKQHHMERTYDLKGWTNATEFLELLARKGGRLLRGGEADLDGVAKMVLNDFMRGRIPWFTPPPAASKDGNMDTVSGRTGRLGEMPKKRKFADSTGDSASSKTPGSQQDSASVVESGDDGDDGGDGTTESSDAASDELSEGTGP